MATEIVKRQYVFESVGVQETNRGFELLEGGMEGTDQAANRVGKSSRDAKEALDGLGRGARGAGTDLKLIPGGAAEAAGALAKTGASARGAGRDLSEADVVIGRFGGALRHLKTQTKEATEEAGKAWGKLADDVGRSATHMAEYAAMAAAAGAVFFVKSAIDVAAQRDQILYGLAALMGGMDKAKKHFAELQTIAAQPGVTLDTALKLSISLQSVGVDAKTAAEAISTFGNALALAGRPEADMERVGVQLQQMISKGKVSAEDLNTLAESLPQVRTVMKDVFQTADPEALQKKLDAAGVSTQQFVGILVAGFKQLPQATDTFANKLVNLKAAWLDILAAFGGAFLGSQGQAGLQQLGDAMAALVPLAKALGEAFVSLLPDVSGFLRTLSDPAVIAGMAQGVKDTTAELLDAFHLIIAGAQLLPEGMEIVRQLWRERWEYVVGAVKAAVQDVWGVLQALGQSIAQWAAIIVAPVEQAFEGLVNIWDAARSNANPLAKMNAMREAAAKMGEGFQQASEQLGRVRENLAKGWEPTQGALAKFGQEWDGLKRNWDSAGAAFEQRSAQWRQKVDALAGAHKASAAATKGAQAAVANLSVEEQKAAASTGKLTDAQKLWQEALQQSVSPEQQAIAALRELGLAVDETAAKYGRLTAAAVAAGHRIAGTVAGGIAGAQQDAAKKLAADAAEKAAAYAATDAVMAPAVRAARQQATRMAQTEASAKYRATGQTMTKPEFDQLVSEKFSDLVGKLQFSNPRSEQFIASGTAQAESLTQRAKDLREKAKGATGQQAQDMLATAAGWELEAKRLTDRVDLTKRAMEYEKDRFQAVQQGTQQATQEWQRTNQIAIEAAGKQRDLAQQQQDFVNQFFMKSPADQLAQIQQWQKQRLDAARDLRESAGNPERQRAAQTVIDAMDATLKRFDATANTMPPALWKEYMRQIAGKTEDPKRIDLMMQGSKERDRASMQDRLTASVLGNLGAGDQAIMAQARLTQDADLVRSTIYDGLSGMTRVIVEGLKQGLDDAKAYARDQVGQAVGAAA